MILVENPDTSLPHGICQPGSVNLQSYLMDMYQLGNSGCYNPDSKLSNGGPSFHTTGQAIDLTCNFYNGDEAARGMECFQWVMDHKEQLDLQQIIGDHQIWSSFDQRIKVYGDNDHMNHIHISLGSYPSVHWIPPEPPAPPVPPAPTPQPEELEVSSTIFYKPINQTHRFWRGSGPHEGHLLHAWNADLDGPMGFEDLFTAYNIHETILPDTEIDVIIDPTDLSLAVTIIVSDGAIIRFSYLPSRGWSTKVAGR